MKKLAVLGAAAAACACAAGATGVASAGVQSNDANGNYLVLDADLTPPASSTKKTASAVGLDFHASFGNWKTGAPYPAAPTVVLTLPKGTVFNGGDLPQCTPPTKGEEVAVESRCGTLQRIGGGQAIVDARALGIPDPLGAGLAAYNGGNHNGKPTIAIFAAVDTPGGQIHAEIPLEYDKKKNTLTLFDYFGGPDNRIAYSFQSFDLSVFRVYKVKDGKKTAKVSLFEAPRKCPKAGWQFSFTAQKGDFAQSASDTQGCVQVKD